MRTINVFLSHRWNNDNEYQIINDWLQSHPYAIFKMYAVSKQEKIDHSKGYISDNRLLEILEQRISVSSLFVAFNDKSYSSSATNWSQIELKIARGLGKKILVIKRWGMNEMPTTLIPYAGVANWQSSSVVSKIKELA